MRKHIQVLLTYSVFILASASFLPANEVAKHVFIISIDGGKPAVIHQSKMPNLYEVINQGSASWNAQTIFPSITLPSHVSMLGGVGPEKHKVLWNDWDPMKGLVSVPTIFTIAKQHKLVTGMFVGKEKFRHLNTPAALDEFAMPSTQAIVIAQTAAKFILNRKPNITFIHFPDTDEMGHKHGWGSPQQIDAFQRVDVALKTVMDAITQAGLSKNSVVIITADHGGHGNGHGSASPEDMTIPWIAWGKSVRKNFAINTPVATTDTAATALWILDLPRPKEWDGNPVTAAFESNDVVRTLATDSNPTKSTRSGIPSGQ